MTRLANGLPVADQDLAGRLPTSLPPASIPAACGLRHPVDLGIDEALDTPRVFSESQIETHRRGGVRLPLPMQGRRTRPRGPAGQTARTAGRNGLTDLLRGPLEADPLQLRIVRDGARHDHGPGESGEAPLSRTSLELAVSRPLQTERDFAP